MCVLCVCVSPSRLQKRTVDTHLPISIEQHCQELAPKWERLAKDYAKSDKYMVAEIDCTATPAAETWCDDDFGIEGFPTMMFGDPGRGGALLEEYQDERDYETLAEFAALMFDTPLCNVDPMDGCTDEIRAQLERYMKMSDADIDAEIERMETEMDEIDENFEDQMDELQNQYDELATNHQIHVASVNKFLKWIDEVKELTSATS